MALCGLRMFSAGLTLLRYISQKSSKIFFKLGMHAYYHKSGHQLEGHVTLIKLMLP